MRRAVDMTKSTNPHPNPRVAAIIVDADGREVSSGVHQRAGEPHAEQIALDGRRFDGHTMVVTLEPCNHTGATPPCTEEIIASGITSVFVGATDPDARVAGKGIERLREAGIDVVTGVHADAVEENDWAYFHHRRTGRAWITLKLASTLDGQVAASDGTSQWITGSVARQDVHRLRSEHDAVLVGSGTAIADDPLLTVRLDEWNGAQPRPIVIVGSRDLPAELAILRRNPLIYRSREGVDLRHVAADVADHGILSVLVEGGPTMAAGLLRHGLVDEIVWYLGAKVAGGVGVPAFAGPFSTLADAVEVSILSVTQLGGDIKVRASVGAMGSSREE